MKKLISNIAIIIALVVTSVSYSNAQNTNGILRAQVNDTTKYTANGTEDDISPIFTQTNNIKLNLDSLTIYDYYYINGNQWYSDSIPVIVNTNNNITTLKVKMKSTINNLEHFQTFTFIIKTKSYLSVKEVEVSNFSVYPNPVVDVLNIKFDAYEDVDVVVMDMSGRIVYNEPTSTMTTVNMSDQPSGMYLVKIGNQTQTFIKK